MSQAKHIAASKQVSLPVAQHWRKVWNGRLTELCSGQLPWFSFIKAQAYNGIKWYSTEQWPANLHNDVI